VQQTELVEFWVCYYQGVICARNCPVFLEIKFEKRKGCLASAIYLMLGKT